MRRFLGAHSPLGSIVGRRSRDDGQTLVVSVLFFGVLLGFCGFTVDAGSWMWQKRNLQGIADAAAMAGVQELPESQGLASSVADSYAEIENPHDATVKSLNVTGDRVEVVMEMDEPGIFAQMFGVDSAHIEARAVARLSQPRHLGPWLPFGIMKDTYTNGELTEMKFDVDGGNTGAIRPPLESNGCNANSAGKDDYRKVIAGDDNACPIEIGGTVQPENGGAVGPTKQGFDRRLDGNTQTFEDVFEWSEEHGKYIIKDPTSPRLGVVPILENMAGGNTWDGGMPELRVIGYQYVYIESYTRFAVNVRFVDAMLPPDADVPMGAYSASNPSPVVRHLAE